MTKEAVQVLRKARELLGPSGENWAQGKYGVPYGPRCVTGACVAAAVADRIGGNASFLALHYLKLVTGDRGAIERWNDAPGRVFADIDAAFKRAIELAEQST